MDKRMNILIVENEEVIIDAAKKILNPEGFLVDDASDAEMAFNKIDQNEYQLILSDLMLPQVSGLELIEKVKQKKPDLPIIIITGYAMLENAVKSFNVGAFDFIPKPFDIEELLGVVHRAINHSRMVQEEFKKKGHSLLEKPKGCYSLGEHSWAQFDTDSVSRIGVGATFPGRIGAIKKIELPFSNTGIWQGNLCVRIISRSELIHMVWAPLSGKVVEINTEVEKNADLINSDPYGDGWLLKIIPTNLENELKNLIRY